MCMCVITVREGHEFEVEQGGREGGRTLWEGLEGGKWEIL